MTTAGPDAVVLDLDGVLVDSEEAWDAARRELVAERGGTWKDDATHAMLGMSSPEWSSYVRDELGVDMTPQEISDDVVKRLVAGFRHDRRPPREGEETHSIVVRVDDAGAHCERAREHGAKILMEPTDFEY